MRVLAQVAAKRMNFEDTSSLMRALLQDAIDTEIPADEQEQILQLFGYYDGKEQPASTELKPIAAELKKSKGQRSGKHDSDKAA